MADDDLFPKLQRMIKYSLSLQQENLLITKLKIDVYNLSKFEGYGLNVHKKELHAARAELILIERNKKSGRVKIV